MDALRELAQLRQRLARARPEPSGASASVRDLRNFPLRDAEAERQRDEPLLRAVVEVALDPAALGVAGLDEAQARRGELVPGVRARDGEGDELREACSRRSVSGGSVSPPRSATTSAPQVRPATLIGTPTLPGSRAARSSIAPGAVEPLVVDRAGAPVRRTSSAVPSSSGSRGRARTRRSARRTCRRSSTCPVLEAVQHGRAEAEQAADLVGHRLEDLLGRRVAGDERGDRAQRRLLVGERPRSASARRWSVKSRAIARPLRPARHHPQLLPAATPPISSSYSSDVGCRARARARCTRERVAAAGGRTSRTFVR